MRRHNAVWQGSFVVLLSIALAFYILTQNWRGFGLVGAISARLFPMGATIALGICGLWLLASGLVQRQPVTAGETDETPDHPEAVSQWDPLKIWAGGVGFLIALQYLGFLVTTPLFLGIMIWSWGMRRPIPLISYVILCTAVLYFAFGSVLKVPLPTGLWLG